MRAAPHAGLKERDQKMRTNAKARTRKHRQDKPSVTEPVAPMRKAKLLVLEGDTRGRLAEVRILWLTAQQTDSDIPESTHASESAKPKTNKVLFTWD